MHAFDVHVNGKRVCVAGIDGDGVVNTIVNCLGKHGRKRLHMTVGGLKSSTEEHLRWTPQLFPLSVGDEILIKLVDTASVDEPQMIKKFDAIKAAQRQNTGFGRFLNGIDYWISEWRGKKSNRRISN